MTAAPGAGPVQDLLPDGDPQVRWRRWTAASAWEGALGGEKAWQAAHHGGVEGGELPSRTRWIVS
ncbi:hypothetical protein [Sinosporangium album]|uniref:hypothetical protein n=1 Tax=Sinosporangium album TaxID=504805 RepID=UPI000B895962|nr:hypothetical protein [Sinosporangium album]